MQHTVRYFAHKYDENECVDVFEIGEGEFQELCEKFGADYERHTVRENGASQICLTVRNFDSPQEQPE